MKKIITVVLGAIILIAFGCDKNSEKKSSLKMPSSDLYGIEEGFVDANGELIYFKAFGRGEPLLILHGGPGASHDYFLPYLLPLAHKNRLIFIDERGSGRSQKLENISAYTIESMAEDVEEVRQVLGLGKISLLGHSCGGVIAEAYALKYQENLSLQYLSQYQKDE